jgi:hypothetical protein
LVHSGVISEGRGDVPIEPNEVGAFAIARYILAADAALELREVVFAAQIVIQIDFTPTLHTTLRSRRVAVLALMIRTVSLASVCAITRSLWFSDMPMVTYRSSVVE